MFSLWIVYILLFAPPSEEIVGADVAGEFVAQLERASPGARLLTDEEWIRIDDNLTEVWDLRTGHRVLVADLIESYRLRQPEQLPGTKGRNHVVLTGSENCAVARIGKTVFLVSRDNVVVAICGLSNYQENSEKFLEVCGGVQ